MFFEDDDDVMVAQFGTGDILLCSGYIPGYIAGTVSLIDRCGLKCKVGDKVMSDDEWLKMCDEKNIKSDWDLNTIIRLVFTNTQSIDTLIEVLKDTKDHMIRKFGGRDELVEAV